jgi:hypothetical protein
MLLPGCIHGGCLGALILTAKINAEILRFLNDIGY